MLMFVLNCNLNDPRSWQDRACKFKTGPLPLFRAQASKVKGQTTSRSARTRPAPCAPPQTFRGSWEKKVSARTSLSFPFLWGRGGRVQGQATPARASERERARAQKQKSNLRVHHLGLEGNGGSRGSPLRLT